MPARSKFIISIACLSVAATIASGDSITNGMNKEQVIAILGTPKGRIGDEAHETLLFERGRVDIVNGQVTEFSVVSETQLREKRQLYAVEHAAYLEEMELQRKEEARLAAIRAQQRKQEEARLTAEQAEKRRKADAARLVAERQHVQEAERLAQDRREAVRIAAAQVLQRLVPPYSSVSRYDDADVFQPADSSYSSLYETSPPVSAAGLSEQGGRSRFSTARDSTSRFSTADYGRRNEVDGGRYSAVNNTASTYLEPIPIEPAHRRGPVTYNSIGSTVFGSDGSTMQRVGNTMFHSDGTSYNRIGNTVFGSDGSTIQNIGNTSFHSGGSSYNRIGNTVFGSDGSTVQKIGNTYFYNP